MRLILEVVPDKINGEHCLDMDEMLLQLKAADTAFMHLQGSENLRKAIGVTRGGKKYYVARNIDSIRVHMK